MKKFRVAALALAVILSLSFVSTDSQARSRNNKYNRTTTSVTVATPVATPVATATPTATPVATPTPTPAPVVEIVAEPTATPAVEIVAEPTATPAVEIVAEPTATPAVEVIAEPTATPAVEVVAEPTATPVVEVVAADNSVLAYGAHSIDEAGYENFDSTSAIQKALNMGGSVDFGSGTYIVKKSLNIISNTVITSSGATINKAFESNGGVALFTTSESNVENVTVSNITLNLRADNSIDEEYATGIYFGQTARNIKIENVTFNNVGSTAINVSQNAGSGVVYSRNIEILNNTVYTEEVSTGAIIMLMSVDGFTVDGNYISRGKGQIWMSFAENGKVTNNTCEKIDNYWSADAHLGGIEMYNGCDNIVVDSNVLSSNGVINDGNIVGIRSKNNTNIYITNNKIAWSNTATEAINVRKDETYATNTSNHYVRGNVITGSSEYGIKMVTIVEGSSIDNVYIENNVLKTSSISLHAATSVTTASYNNIHINNNVASNIASWQFANKDCEITNNTVYATGSVGIYARDMVSSKVSGNTIINSGTSMQYGIDYSYSSGMSIEKNIFVNVTEQYKSYGSMNVSLVI